MGIIGTKSQKIFNVTSRSRLGFFDLFVAARPSFFLYSIKVWKLSNLQPNQSQIKQMTLCRGEALQEKVV